MSVDFFDVYLSPDVAVNIDVETAYRELWKASQRTREASTMAVVRLSMTQTFGEEKQRELIGQWNQ